MNYPLISEYLESIKNAEDNFATLTNLRPVLDEDGNPIMSNGNFAVVFKMRDIVSNNYYAVKCFTREQEGRKKAYKTISNTISKTKSEYLINVKFLDYELYVDSKNSSETEFPVLIMDWVEGITLDKFIQQYIGNSFELHDLCVSFGLLCKWLSGECFAHGDLKPDNIIVRPDGSIVLIDYDGMYVSSMEGQKARELGSVNYRHPLRSETVFNKHIDDFAMAAIALSLKAISISYGILDEYKCEDSFLFSQNDYISLEDSVIFQYLLTLMYKDASITPYISTFMLAYQRRVLTPSDFEYGDSFTSSLLTTRQFFTRKGEPMDENGVIYSFDGTRVLSFDYDASDVIDVEIKEGVICICEDAFSSYKKRKLNITLPESVRFFTKDSFSYNFNNLKWETPWFVYKDGFIYTKDFTGCILQHLVDAKIDNRVKIIERNCFHYMNVKGICLPSGLEKIKEHAFSCSTIDENLAIPESVMVVGNSAFSSCDGLKYLRLNQKLRSLGEWCFSFCQELEMVSFPNSCEIRVISNHAFHNCRNLRKLELPSSLRSIDDEAFQWCSSLEEICFPETLISIGKRAFNMYGRSDPHKEPFPCLLKKIIIPQNIETIGAEAFRDCSSLNKVVVKSDKVKFEDSVFENCCELSSFEAEHLRIISKRLFNGCANLTFLLCPNIEFIGEAAFEFCSNLEFQMPNSVKSIGFAAFNGIKNIVTNENFVYENRILFDKDKKCLISCNQIEKKINIPEGTVTTSKEAFNKIPDYFVLPNTLSDKSIMELLSLKSKYIQLPNDRSIDDTIPIINEEGKKYCSRYYISANMYGHSSAFLDEEGVLYSDDKKKLLKYPMSLQLLKYSILPECEEIGDNAFEGFEDCDPEFGMYYPGNMLEELILPPNLQSIGNNALEGCRKIQELILPDSVVKLGNNALEGCHSIKKIILPTSLCLIGTDALPRHLENVMSNSCKYHCCGDCLLSENDEIVWISSTITQFDLPPIVKYLGKDCVTYRDCIVSRQGELLITIPEIESFRFPNGIRTIARESFTHNKKIKELRIPNGVTSIEYGAFCCNQSLRSIFLPKTIEHIGSLHTYQGWGRKYIEFFYPQEIHVPKGMKRHFLDLMPDVPENTLVDDYDENN